MMRWLIRFLRVYLIASGLLANLALAALLGAVAVLGVGGMIDMARAGLPMVAEQLAKPLRHWDLHRAQRKARSLGLVATTDAYYEAEVAQRPERADRAGRILKVGLGRDYLLPSAAARAALPGDVIEIDAGDYAGDSAVWATDRLVIRALGGTAHIRGEGVALVEEKALWLVQGDDIRIEHIEFSGARSRDRNGAGIRAEGDRLHVFGCFFHDNETGLLSNPVAGGSLVIEHSEFARNGHPDGQAHQIYINDMQRFELRFSYIHDSVVGSAVKSRAAHNLIAYNRIIDGAEGSSNYSIDLTDGGVALLAGNVLEQGPRSENPQIVAYATESAAHQPQQLVLIHNTLVNDRHDGVFVFNHGTAPAHLYNNLLLGPGRPFTGTAVALGNVVVRDGWPALGDASLGGTAGSSGNRVLRGRAVRGRGLLDYRLRADSPARDAGVQLDNGAGLEMVPAFEYHHPLASIPRKTEGTPDAGAFEFAGAPELRPESRAAAGD